MRILLLTPGAYGVNGGIALYNRDLIDALILIPEVCEIAVLPRAVTMAPEPIPSRVRFVAGAAGSKMHFIAHLAAAMARHYDLVICGHINLATPAIVAARRSRAPLVILAYGIDVWDEPSPTIARRLRAVNAVWTISQLTGERMNAWAKLPKTIYTILPNAIHLDRYGIDRPEGDRFRERFSLQGRKVLLTLARLPGFDRYKGVDEVLECLPDLAKAVPEISYVVAGDGEDRPRLEEKVRRLGVADRVLFAGYVDERDKAGYYRMADLFVLPGRGEGFGFVFLEALACGIPVVGSRIDGSREALRDGLLGELVDPRDPDEVRAAILRGLDKPKTIPEGLAYFAWPRFEERVQAALLAVLRKTA